MILGRDIMSELGITLNFKDQTMTWDDSTINMKDPESLLDLLDPVNDFFWSNNQFKTEVLQEASVSRKFSMQSRHRRTLTQLYRHANTSWKMRNVNCMPLFANTNIYLMTLWGHGIMNPTILNLRKGLSLIIADLFLLQKFISTI